MRDEDDKYFTNKGCIYKKRKMARSTMLKSKHENTSMFYFHAKPQKNYYTNLMQNATQKPPTLNEIHEQPSQPRYYKNPSQNNKPS